MKTGPPVLEKQEEAICALCAHGFSKQNTRLLFWRNTADEDPSSENPELSKTPYLILELK